MQTFNLWGFSPDLTASSSNEKSLFLKKKNVLLLFNKLYKHDKQLYSNYYH